MGGGFDYIFNIVTMTVTRCLSSFFSRFLQRIVREFLALFRFNETDVCVILSAYGLRPFEIDRLQGNHPEQAESASKKKVARVQPMAQPTGPIPIGIHPDFASGNWRQRHWGSEKTQIENSRSKLNRFRLPAKKLAPKIS
jgi:hypothetical protein